MVTILSQEEIEVKIVDDGTPEVHGDESKDLPPYGRRPPTAAEMQEIEDAEVAELLEIRKQRKSGTYSLTDLPEEGA